MKVRNVQDVAEAQMCTGCGACAYISPDQVEMVDVVDHGLRPRLKEGAATGPGAEEAMKVCPGISLEHDFDSKAPGLIQELVPAWGPVLEVWEGHALDAELRHAASSGGAASALALYCIEKEGMHGTLHINSKPEVPYQNHTVLSRTRAEFMAATGSRYAPASPCDGLAMVEEAPAPCVFIGKPCDVAATSKARQLRPRLDENLGLTIAIFCAGTPSTRGTLEMLAAMGVEDPAQVTSVRYRGIGWPGKATASFQGDGNKCETRELSYEESWGDILQKHRQWRCYLCLDHSGEFADIAVGDPWYRTIGTDEPGSSLILARTERGRRILEGAVGAGYLAREPREPHTVPDSQRFFPPLRGKIWGRLWALRLAGAPLPRYRNMPMFRFWWRELGFVEKLKSFLGTWRRVARKGLRRRAPVVPFEPGKRCSEPVEQETRP